MATREPGVFAGKRYGPEDIALQFGIPVEVASGWVDSGLIERNKYGVIDRAQLLRFINSAGGQAALAAARHPS